MPECGGVACRQLEQVQRAGAERAGAERAERAQRVGAALALRLPFTAASANNWYLLLCPTNAISITLI